MDVSPLYPCLLNRWSFRGLKLRDLRSMSLPTCNHRFVVRFSWKSFAALVRPEFPSFFLFLLFVFWSRLSESFVPKLLRNGGISWRVKSLIRITDFQEQINMNKIVYYFAILAAILGFSSACRCISPTQQTAFCRAQWSMYSHFPKLCPFDGEFTSNFI